MIGLMSRGIFTCVILREHCAPLVVLLSFSCTLWGTINIVAFNSRHPEHLTKDSLWESPSVNVKAPSVPPKILPLEAVVALLRLRFAGHAGSRTEYTAHTSPTHLAQTLYHPCILGKPSAPTFLKQTFNVTLYSRSLHFAVPVAHSM